MVVGQNSFTDNFVRQAGYEHVADDTNRSLARQFQTAGGQPIFVIINGTANSSSHEQWELLLHQNGYGSTRHPIDLFRSVIDSVKVLPTSPPPSIVAQPQGQIASLGTAATLSVTAEGADLNYQWQFDGVDIAGATKPTLILDNVRLANEGSYSVRVTNAGGVATSSDALLIVNQAPVKPPQIDRIEIDGNNISFEYRSEPPAVIVIEYTESLAMGAWTILKTISPTMESATVSVSDTISASSQRFYRLRIAE